MSRVSRGFQHCSLISVGDVRTDGEWIARRDFAPGLHPGVGSPGSAQNFREGRRIVKLGLTVGYSGRGMGLPIDLILEAERLGFDSVWTAEAYGSDAITPLAWIGAQTTRSGSARRSCRYRRARPRCAR